jgi:drug/metabolite transporter (DMT)-like permease
VRLLRGGGRPTRAAWPGILGSGLLWFGLYMVTLNWGERDIDAGIAAILVNIGPILLALLGGWLLHEGFARRLAAGMAVSFGGVLVVGISESDGGRTSIIGVVLCLVAAVCYAGGVVRLPFAGQLLSQLGAPYNPRGRNLRRSRPSRHGDQRARRMTTGTVDLVREDY